MNHSHNQLQDYEFVSQLGPCDKAATRQPRMRHDPPDRQL
jgi:hypothetical protein